MPNWTKQQSDAIKAKNSNILVSAAAGSGKTAALVQRVVNILTDESAPVSADRLLILTFTNAAAAEMKSRISASLEDILSRAPSNIYIQRQLSLLSVSKICTVDSFCLNLVKENFFTLGISRDFSVLDDAQIQVMTDSALDSVLDRAFEEYFEEIASLTRLLAAPKDEKEFKNTIKRVYTYIYSQPFPHKWLDSVCENYNPDIPLEKSVWYPYLTEEIIYALDTALEYAESARSVLAECPDDIMFEPYSANLNEDFSVIENLRRSFDGGWNEVCKAFAGVKFGRLASRKNYTSPIKDDFVLRRNIYKGIIDEISRLVCADSEEYKADAEKLYPVLKTLCRVVGELDRELTALKEERNGYSFADIEHFAISLLCKNENSAVVPSDLALELQKSFFEILIDEYQDTNEAQDLIYSLLSNGNNRFMVGDIKQSIYRFRLAMPHIFIKKRNDYLPYEGENGGSRKIIFDKNFRSKKGVCDYVNFLFSAIMSEKTGEIDYNEEEYLNYGADYNDNGVACAQLKILNGVKGENTDLLEAQYISETINEKIAKKELIRDGGVYRPIRYGDFAILLRSMKNHAPVYNEVLTANGIPVVCDNAENMFDCAEIKILTSLLRVIDNPAQDIPLLSVMSSPLYGFTPDELSEIRISGRSGMDLYACVLNSKSDKAERMLSELEMLSELSVTSPVSYFIRYICEFKSVYAFAGALGNGEQRCANIDKFISYAADYDSSGSVGLTSFIRYIDKVAESDNGFQSAANTAVSENAVKIMSVHHSKGLEFPVVILAGSERKYNMRDLNGKFLLHPIVGPGVKMHVEDGLYDYDTLPYAVVHRLNKAAMQSENLRVLYVAVTRAKEQFISFITTDNLSGRLNSLASKISGGKLSPYHCRNIMYDGDFILADALTHPDCGELRELSGIACDVRNADFSLDVEIKDPIENESVGHEEVKAGFDAEMLADIKARAEYKYKYSELSCVSAKLTASELDESIKTLDYTASSKPAFLSDGEMTPAQKGTAMHAFMQFCDYEGAKADLEGEIERLANRSFITPEQADCLDRKALKTLFSGDLSKRIFEADRLYRELKISSFVKLRDISETDSDEEILIQGISDCVFEENGELVIVDYKTDRVKDEEQLLSMYKNQIEFYKYAVSKTLGKRVKEALLYSFALSKICRYK